MVWIRTRILAGFALALLAACGDSGSGSNTCVPGERDACTCLNGDVSFRDCGERKVWLACGCSGDQPDGGGGGFDPQNSVAGAAGTASGVHGGTRGDARNEQGEAGIAGQEPDSNGSGGAGGPNGEPTGGETAVSPGGAGGASAEGTGGQPDPTGGSGGQSDASGGSGGQPQTIDDGCETDFADYCSCMPRFEGAQVVDGLGDEFGGLPAMTFALASAPYVNPGRAAPLPEQATLRAGWSEQALHLHVHVEDPVIGPDPGSDLWNGDNVQFFFAGTATLTGTYTGTEDGGAIHVLVSAPDAADFSRATVIYQNGVASNTPFISGQVAGRRVSTGYEIEAELLFATSAEPRQSGSRIGFDLIVGASGSPDGGLELEAGLANNPVASAPACELGGIIQPGCDDRTWCTPTLGP